MVIGRNGQGKTNLVEALQVLSKLSSARAQSPSVLVRHGQEQALLNATAEVNGRSVSVRAQIPRTGGVKLVVNGVPLSKATAASPSLATVLFSPDDLELIKGGPEQRRRYLDDAAITCRPLAAVERQEFEKVLRNRNAALKAAQANHKAMIQLEVWTQQMARTGAVVVSNRLQVLTKITPSVNERYRRVGGHNANVELIYEPTWAPAEFNGEPTEVLGELTGALERSQRRDMERGISLVGPHRDDVKVVLNGAEARLYASQGEQRSLALAFRLAERDLITELRGEDPILLLDDVFSELDDQRRAQVAALVRASGQTIATATSTEGVPSEVGNVLVVEAGRLVGHG